MKKLGSGKTVGRARVSTLISILKKRYGVERKLSAPFRVLISALLSHRTKDEVTWRVSSALFCKYKTPEDFVSLSTTEIEALIKGVGFYKVKAKRIKAISRILISKWDSKVPSSVSALLSLPGVGRKTANCVLAYGFGLPALPVDTHVHRISNRLGLVTTRTPEATELSLMRIVPKKYWGWLSTALVEFGKETCKPINPQCEKCALTSICSYYFSCKRQSIVKGKANLKVCPTNE